MNKKSTLVHFVLLGALLIYSFMFYKTIAWELAVLATIFILLEPNIFIEAKKRRGLERIGFSILLAIFILFNLLAISSGFINDYTKESETKTLNNQYVRQQEKLKQLKTSLASTETELNSYPTLESYTAKSPKWEDKTELNQTWQKGKQDITARLDGIQKEYNKELSTNIDKYKITTNNNGYTAVFIAISDKINVKTSNLTIIIYMLFAIVLEILVFYTKVLSVKESNNYEKTEEEEFIDFAKEMRKEINRNCLGMMRNSFGQILNQSGPETEEPEQKLLEESKGDQQENLTQNDNDNPPKKSEPEPIEILEEVPEEKPDEVIIKKDTKVLSQRYKHKTFKRKGLNESAIDKVKEDFNVKNDENLMPKAIINLVKTDNENSPKILGGKTDKKIDKVLSARIKKIKMFLSENFEPGECITASKIKTKFKLKDHEYRKVLELLKNENVVYTDNKKTYLSNKLKAVK